MHATETFFWQIINMCHSNMLSVDMLLLFGLSRLCNSREFLRSFNFLVLNTQRHTLNISNSMSHFLNLLLTRTIKCLDNCFVYFTTHWFEKLSFTFIFDFKTLWSGMKSLKRGGTWMFISFTEFNRSTPEFPQSKAFSRRSILFLCTQFCRVSHV